MSRENSPLTYCEFGNSYLLIVHRPDHLVRGEWHPDSAEPPDEIVIPLRGPLSDDTMRLLRRVLAEWHPANNPA
jgi:hypothetical protein